MGQLNEKIINQKPYLIKINSSFHSEEALSDLWLKIEEAK